MTESLEKYNHNLFQKNYLESSSTKRHDIYFSSDTLSFPEKMALSFPQM